METSRLLNKF